MARNVRNKENNEVSQNDEINQNDEVIEKDEKVENRKQKKEKDNNPRLGFEKEKSDKKKKTILLVILISVICILFVVNAILIKVKVLKKSSILKDDVTGVEDVMKDIQKPLSIYNSDKRTVGVMVSNEPAAWPQAGLQEAYMVYECLIEGGQTRFLALFKENEPEKIGPIRSARHYFAYFLKEHDAIYTHFGWSPLAQEVIQNNNINNINGIYDTYYYREGAGYNNAFTSMKTVKQFATDKKYNLKSSKEPIYTYSVKDYNLETNDTKFVNKINIKYSNAHSVQYIYDPDRKVFLRSMRNQIHVDRVTKEQLYAKNIIILYEEYTDLNDYSGSPRRQLAQVGTGKGTYITNGRYIDVTWSKTSNNAKTEIKDLAGNDITLNDGITFVQVVPKEYTAVLAE